jgi:hypothetical protein
MREGDCKQEKTNKSQTNKGRGGRGEEEERKHN